MLTTLVTLLCVVACTRAERATAAEIAAELEGSVEFSDVSDGVSRYYAERYFDASHLMFGGLGDAGVHVVDRPGGFDPEDARAVARSARQLPGDDPIEVLIHDGVAIVVTSDDPAAVGEIRRILDR